MKYLQKLNFGGGKSIGLLLLLFLMLGNSGVWAQDLSIDFEETADTYTDWTFTNITTKATNSGVTPHGGSFFGNTSGKTTASITTKNIISSPEKISFWVSKQSSNTTTSTWKVEVSTDATEWTLVGSGQSASSMKKGDWVNVSRDLTSYKDVYVRIYYDGTSAIRCIDDVTLSCASGPSITASDVEYSADITSGAISYTINNPVEGTEFKASTTTEWIQNVTVDAENSKVTFNMSENTETTPRTGNITLTYGSDVTKDVIVTQLAAVAKRTVTIETPENGTLKVMRDNEEVTSGDLIPVGTELTIEATPAEGYKFRNWQAVDKSTHTYTANFNYTVGENDVTFKANFDKIVYHTVTWSVNGVTTTESVEEGQDVTFFTPAENIPEGYVFKGWYGSTLGPQDYAPEYVTSATATADVTYYAVFAKGNGGETETATLTASHTAADTTPTSHSYTDDKGNVWNTYSTEQSKGDDARFGLNTNAGYYFGSPVFSGTVTEIEMSVYNGSSTSARTFYIDSKETNQSGDLGTISVAAGEKNVVKTATLKSDFNKFYVHVSAALSFKYIKVTYSSEVFTDFRTSVTDVPTATITLAEACTDGEGMYYGTYSSSKAFVVPGDIKVSEIRIIDNKLDVYEYKEKDVVPANTGVMVSAMTAGDHKVTLSEEEGSSLLGEENMLRPSGDNGITADEMAEAAPGCKYYRLTMHKGTTLGYYWGALEGAAFGLAANKAYLAVPEEQAAKVAGFGIGGGSTTDIAGITAGAANDGARKVYNLQGQRVSGALAKGLYIIDGKKVIIK